ncbi:hypothetical protein F5Y09DRAFT_347339 [Xylaria sp. FL1042]|nr:hypothetical protein F5Y09DRAFT_347339 [Xylaria sp. FL1042]
MRIRTGIVLKVVPISIPQLLPSTPNADAQAIPDDSVLNFSICGAGDFLNGVVDCETNACLCRPSTLEEGVEFIDEKVMSLCSNYDDQSTATDFLLRYCSAHGNTSVGTAAEPTGAFLTATVTVTQIVAATQTVFRSSTTGAYCGLFSATRDVNLSIIMARDSRFYGKLSKSSSPYAGIFALSNEYGLLPYHICAIHDLDYRDLHANEHGQPQDGVRRR